MSPVIPFVSFDPVLTTWVLSVITIGTLLVKICPLSIILSPFHCCIPHSVSVVSNQYVPSTGSAPGAVADASNSARSTSALVTNARFATPRKLYAACNPYSFNSLPCIGLLLVSVLKIGSPKVSTRSRCDVSKYGTPAFFVKVPAAVAVPAPFFLFAADTTKIIGKVPGSAGV